MPKPRLLIAALLAGTALGSSPALAQDTGPATVPQVTPPTGETATEAPDGSQTPPDDAVPGIEQDTAAEEEIEVSAPGADGGEIVVQGRFIPQPVRSTAQVVNVLSTEEIARAGDGDIAGALSRVTGLSVNTNGFVFVRGLGDRYSLALLNGLSLPSPEPLRRVVPLDLFPTSVVSSALVQKSYSVNYPGEFGGGVINLTTPSIPDENFLTIGAGISGVSETTARFGYTYYGSDLDVIGYDDGTRSLDGSFGNALSAGQPINSGSYSQADLSGFATRVPVAATGLLQGNFDIPANFSANLSGGYSTYFGDTRVGVIVNGGFSNGFRTRDATQQVANIQDFTSNAQVVRTENRIVANGLLGIGVEFDDDNSIRFTNLYIHDTSKLARRAGVYVDVGAAGDELLQREGTLFDQVNDQTAYIERQLINSQLVGEFEVGDFNIEARGAYANSTRKSPYEWDITYRVDPVDGSYVNDLQVLRPTVSFSDLDEDVWNGAIDVGYALPTDRSITLSAGYSFTDVSRTFTNRELEFRDTGSDLSTDPLLDFERLPIQYLLSDGSISYNGIIVSEISNTFEVQYFGDLTVHAGYAKADVELADGLRLDLGVRFESGEQTLTLADFFGTGGGNFVRRIQNDYWLPAATVTWNFAEDFQLRVHGSKTIARPQFREQAPIAYTDVESDRRFTGNPFLEDSELLNFEARIEFYPARNERISIAGFYKDIENPIETTAIFDPNGLTTSFANAPSAELYGGEVEVVKYFYLDTLSDAEFFATKRLVLSANYTYSQSEITVGDGDQIQIFNPGNPTVPFVRNGTDVFVSGLPITGQSEHLANIQFGFEDTEELQQITVLLNYASDRVSLRGPFSAGGVNPDVVEEPGISLDIVVRQGFEIQGLPLEMKFEARNITGTDFIERQDGDGYRVLNNAYDVGTTFAASIGAKF